MPRDTTPRLMLGKIIATQDAVAGHIPANDGSEYRRHYEAALNHLESAEDQMRRAALAHETRQARADVGTLAELRVLDDAPVPLYDRR